MGIKGKRRREREREQKRQAAVEAGELTPDGSDDGGVADDFPAHLMMGGPFAPPPGRGLVSHRLSRTEAADAADREYLERVREEHANRRKSHLDGAGKKKKKKKNLRGGDDSDDDGAGDNADGGLLRPMRPLDDEAAAVDLTAEALHAARHGVAGAGGSGDGTQTKRTAADGARFSNALVGLHPAVVAALAAEGFARMTRIQQRAIPLALQHYDLMGQAKTGSGKTLAFVVPVLHAAVTAILSSSGGDGGSSRKGGGEQLFGLMLAPTKELCVQTHTVLSALCAQLREMSATSGGVALPPLTSQLITGGTKVKEERRALLEGRTFVVGTPGRLRDHVLHCKGWRLAALRALVLDEADRMLDIGFREDLESILAALPRSRQTFLFSATSSKAVAELARLSVRPNTLFVATKGPAPVYAMPDDAPPLQPPPYVVLPNDSDDDDDDGTAATKKRRVDKTTDAAAAAVATGEDEEDIPSLLRQFCHVMPAEDRLRCLYVFVKRVARRSKAMIFCSTVASTVFHCQMMGAVGFHEEVLMLHGQMKHRQRVATFAAFNDWPTGVLFCTDVAARGLDIPRVEWILQFDPPLDPTEYVHRVGRTARAGGVGNALLFLTAEERGFVKYLARFGITMEAYPMGELPDIQAKLEHTLQLDAVVAKSAVTAFRAHVGAYQSHVLRETFNVANLDLDALATAFALTATPSVSISRGAAGSAAPEEKKAAYVKGKLRSLNRRRKEALRYYEDQKTKPQWTNDGVFVGVSKPAGKLC